MHIPDGYLSPSSCATLYALAIAGWYGALRRIKRLLSTRTIPLISVFAAFCFVVMMFNVPLPGGTTGHALGVTIATVVLGPSGSILAVSIAITIQALFFGDGGITTLGANCFNMAIVGSLVAYGVYHLISAKAEVSAQRRVVAAAVAGYLAVNASALLAAFEFGIQPQLFHDAYGTPLYSPYPLHIAVPAMMIGHLSFAGLAEAAISAGMISYLQRADISLLRGEAVGHTAIEAPGRVRSATPVWMVVGLMMLLTPLGILAAGTAWGEWRPAEMPAQMDAPSAQPIPAGLEKLANIWTAPFPGYAPSFIRARSFGYFLSAVFGVGLLLVAMLLARSVARRRRTPEFHS
jgi:cobalt/nickel transport system permease protein